MTRLALAAVVALVLALSACGGGANEPGLWVDTAPDFADAAKRTLSQSSAYELRGDEFNLGDRTEFVCDGGVDNVRPAARHVCEGGQTDGTEMRRIGDTSYRWIARTAKWERWADVDFMTELSSTSPSTPLAWVELTADARRVGEEVVRGDRTVRYELAFDCDRIETCVESEVKVWIDGDGLVRRVESFSEPYTYRWEFFDFGVAVEMEEPSRDDIEEPRPPAEVACGSQPAGPITALDTIDVFGRHGFDIGPYRGVECTEGIAAYLSSRGGYPGVVKGSGQVICTVSAEGWNGGVPQFDVAFGQAGEMVENVGCLLAYDGPYVSERVAAFEDALKELKREHGG
jgi:hypothetical protein